MNTEFEELVRDSMHWFAADLKVPPDLAGKARREHRRRNNRARVAFGSLAVAAAATSMAIVLGIGALAPAGRANRAPGRAPASVGRVPAGQPARLFLIAMATKAGQQKTGRFWCADIIQGTRELVGQSGQLLSPPWLNGTSHPAPSAPPGFEYALFSRSRSIGCTKGSDNSWHAVLDQALGARPASPADARAWRRHGSPTHWHAWYASQDVFLHPSPATRYVFTKPGTSNFGGKNDLGVPTSPAKLRTFLLAHPPQGIHGHNLVLAEGALEVMSLPVLPAARAAALRLLASLPDVRMRPGVTLPDGQTGTAVWTPVMSKGGLSYESNFLLIDSATGNTVGSETLTRTPVAGAAPGTVLFYSADTSEGWTNQLPAGLQP